MKRIKNFVLNHPFVSAFIIVLLVTAQCDFRAIGPDLGKPPIIFASSSENEVVG
jgi:hypothetical protein